VDVGLTPEPTPALRARSWRQGFKGFFVGQADFIQKTLVGAANPDILINAFKMSGPIITGVWTDVLKPAGGFIQDTAAEWWESRK